MLWSVESLNGHSNISIFVSAFTLACALSVKDGRWEEGGWMSDRQAGGTAQREEGGRRR